VVARSQAQRSCLEVADVGADTGTPVLENYADNLPFRFTDTLKKFVVILEPQKLTEAEKSVCLRRRLGL